MVRNIIIDTDPGVDDAMAIFLAMTSPELDVIGLTTIFGNVDTELATTNALRLLEIAGRAEIPVAKGVEAPLTRPFAGPVAFLCMARMVKAMGFCRPPRQRQCVRRPQPLLSNR